MTIAIIAALDLRVYVGAAVQERTEIAVVVRARARASSPMNKSIARDEAAMMNVLRDSGDLALAWTRRHNKDDDATMRR